MKEQNAQSIEVLLTAEKQSVNVVGKIERIHAWDELNTNLNGKCPRPSMTSNLTISTPLGPLFTIPIVSRLISGVQL